MAGADGIKYTTITSSSSAGKGFINKIKYNPAQKM
jgi:hypothetical protein